MLGNPLSGLRRCSQGGWVDFSGQRMREHGGLQHPVEKDGVSGITSNPAILQQAISERDDCRQVAVSLSPSCDSSEARHEALVLEAIRLAADGLTSVYEQTGKGGHHVSVKVSPRLARDSEATALERQRSRKEPARP